MRKLRRSAKERKCYDCAEIIKKGDEYGQVSVRVGSQSCYAMAGPVPDSSWQPYRVNASLCESCSIQRDPGIWKET